MPPLKTADIANQTNNYEIKFLDQCLAYALPILYFLITISFYLKTYDSAQIKITLLQMGGTIILSLWLVKLIAERFGSFKKNIIFLAAPLLIYWALGPISYIHSAFPGTSLDELIRRIMYVGFGLVVLFEWNTYEKFDRLLLWVLLAGFLSSLYGIMQWLDINFFPKGAPGLDPFIWRQAFGVRIFSTHGNPNFFGNFLVIITPLILSLLLKDFLRMGNLIKPLISIAMMASIIIGLIVKNYVEIGAFFSKLPLIGWAIKIMVPHFFNITLIMSVMGLLLAAAISFRWAFKVIFFVMISFCIIATGSKGAMLGYAAALSIFAIFSAIFFLKGRLKFVRIPIFGGMLFIVIMIAILIGQLSFARIDSIRFRIFTWLSTIEMIRTHPVCGTGLGTFKTTYPAYRRPAIFHIEGKSNTETDHPENEFLEVWYDDGLVGFGLFSWIVVFFSYLGLKDLKRFSNVSHPHTGSKGKPFEVIDDIRAYYMLGFLSAFLSMLIHNLVDVSMRFVSSGIFLWLLAGLIGALYYHEPLKSDQASSKLNNTHDKKNAEDKQAKPSEFISPFLSIIKIGLIVVIFASVIFIIREFNMIQQPAPGPGNERFFSWGFPWLCFLIVAGGAGYIMIRSAWNMSSVPQGISIAVSLCCIYIFWGYFVADAHHNVGIFYSKKADWIPALDNYNQVIKRNPNYIMAHYFMGNVYNDRWAPGDWKLALQKYDDVKKLAPNYVQVHHQNGMVYLKLGEAAKARNDTEKMNEYWEKALDSFSKYRNLDPVFTQNYMHLGYLCVQKENYPKAEEYYREALSEKPNDLEAIVNLGNIRYIQNDYQEAEQQYIKALNISQTYPGALKNLAILYGKTGRIKESSILWQKLREVAPNDPDVQKVFAPQQSG